MLRKVSMSILLLALLACSPSRPATLYERLGGSVGLDRIVDGFILEIAGDDRVFPYFADSNVQRFREKITEHFCVIADGPCAYTGDSMVRVHGGMNIGEGDFNAVVEDLIAAMKLAGIPLGIQNELLARLAPLRGEIIRL